MQERFGHRLRLGTLIAALALMGLVATSATPALSAVSPLKLAKKALALAKKADKKATQALARPAPTAPAGVPGPKGDAGAAGSAGATGLRGNPGPDGPQGLPGATGATGAIGATGPIGATGGQGPAGPTGPALRFRGEWEDTEYEIGDVVKWEGSAWINPDGRGRTNEPPGSPWQLMVQKGDPGAQGPEGLQGPQGVPGAPGANGFGSTFVGQDTFQAAPAAVTVRSIPCPASLPKAVGGGFSFPEQAASVATVLESRPLINGTGWVVGMRNGGNSLAITVGMYVVCAG